MAVYREKFATQMSPQILESLRQFAKSENRQIQSVLEEAVADLLEKRGFNCPNREFIHASEQVMEQFPETLKYLAS